MGLLTNGAGSHRSLEPDPSEGQSNPRFAKNGELTIYGRMLTSLTCGARVVALQRGAIIRPWYSTYANMRSVAVPQAAERTFPWTHLRSSASLPFPQCWCSMRSRIAGLSTSLPLPVLVPWGPCMASCKARGRSESWRRSGLQLLCDAGGSSPALRPSHRYVELSRALARES